MTKTSNERQAAYRQRVKNAGGIYLGFYVRGEAAELVRKVRATTGASFAKIATAAILQGLKASAGDVQAKPADDMSPDQKPAEAQAAPRTPSAGDYDWEELK